MIHRWSAAPNVRVPELEFDGAEEVWFAKARKHTGFALFAFAVIPDAPRNQASHCTSKTCRPQGGMSRYRPWASNSSPARS